MFFFFFVFFCFFVFSLSSLSFLSLFLPCPSLSSPLLPLFSLCLGDDTKWPTRVGVSVNPTQSIKSYGRWLEICSLACLSILRADYFSSWEITEVKNCMILYVSECLLIINFLYTKKRFVDMYIKNAHGYIRVPGNCACQSDHIWTCPNINSPDPNQLLQPHCLIRAFTFPISGQQAGHNWTKLKEKRRWCRFGLQI